MDIADAQGLFPSSYQSRGFPVMDSVAYPLPVDVAYFRREPIVAADGRFLLLQSYSAV